MDAEAVEQGAGAAFHGGDGALVTDLGLQQALLGGGELGLRVEDEKEGWQSDRVTKWQRDSPLRSEWRAVRFRAKRGKRAAPVRFAPG